MKKMSLAVVVFFAATMGFAGVVGAQSTGGSAIDEGVFVKSGDTKIFVHLKGEKKNAPVLLHLHGGPANPMGILAFEAYPGPALEEKFIVAYMHQRGVLSSPDVPDSTLTVAHHIRDVDNVVEYLKKK